MRQNILGHIRAYNSSLDLDLDLAFASLGVHEDVLPPGVYN